MSGPELVIKFDKPFSLVFYQEVDGGGGDNNDGILSTNMGIVCLMYKQL